MQRPILRRCISCKKLLDRQQLLRVIRNKQDGVVLNGKSEGRSAYLCPNEVCLQDVLRRKRLQKALRCKVPTSVIEVLQRRLNDCINAVIEAR